jgi:hypothetical protein
MKPEKRQGVILIARIARNLAPHTCVVEIGTHKGEALSIISADLPNGVKAYGVDPWTRDSAARSGLKFNQPQVNRNHRMAIDRCGHATLVKGYSKQVAQDWQGGKVGLLFIDGSHKYQDVIDDYYAWHHHLADNAVVAFDDYGPVPKWQEVRDAVDMMRQHGYLDEFSVVANRYAITSNYKQLIGAE